MGHLGLTNRGYFKEHHLDPLLQSSMVAMTNPGNPTASNQRYVLTETGVKLKARRISKNSRQSEEDNNG
jgi:ATP-dependent DNA helicase RecG